MLGNAKVSGEHLESRELLTTVAGDFNGDGFDDTAFGIPGEDVGSVVDAGAVNVIYGSSDGITAAGNQFLHQNSAGIAGVAEPNDNFGSALAVGDFNKDGFDDLAIGVPGESVGTLSRAGAVNVIYGSANGLSGANDQLWSQNSSGIRGGSEAFDRFGEALATGDFDNDGFDDLAIGVPGEAIGTLSRAGAVNVIYGQSFSAGLTSSGNQVWSQNSSGIEGDAEVGDAFGAALSAGDFNRDGRDDLAIGVPGEGIGSSFRAGAVNVIYGRSSSSGLTSSRDQIWHQNRPGVEGEAERGDAFGSALAAGDFNGDGQDDLAIGVPGEAVASAFGAGSVNVLYGSRPSFPQFSSDLTALGDQIWHQNSSGIAGGVERNDMFGSSLAAADFNGDGVDDLAIGVPGESLGSIASAGAVNVLYGRNSSSGLSAQRDQMWHQNSSGIAGLADRGDSFGYFLGAGDFNGDGRYDLIVGVHEDVAGGSPAINVIYGTSATSGLTSAGDQMWHQDSPGIIDVAEATDRIFVQVT